MERKVGRVGGTDQTFPGVGQRAAGRARAKRAHRCGIGGQPVAPARRRSAAGTSRRPTPEAAPGSSGRSDSPAETAGDRSERGNTDLARQAGAVAVIAPCPFPANHGTPGGIREILQTQIEQGYEIHVFTYPLRDESEPVINGLTMHRMPMLGMDRRIKVGPMWRKPLWNAMIVLAIWAAAAKHKFNVIHAYNYEGALFGWVARLLIRRPLIFHHFNTMIDELPTYKTIMPTWFARWLGMVLDYWVPRMATRIIAISDPIERFLLSKGIPPGRIVKIPKGVDPSMFRNRDGASVRAEHGVGDRPIVMYAGLLNRFQRIDWLFEAMADVRRSRPDACLMLVTNYIEPQDRAACERLIDALGLRQAVIITEPQPFARVPDHLAAADVCVVSRAHCPGVPIKMLNYMAAGKPIVVPEGSSMGLKHRQDAYVVPDHDSRAIGRAIVELLEDDALRARLATNAPLTLERRFGLSTICDRIGRVYAGFAVSRDGR